MKIKILCVLVLGTISSAVSISFAAENHHATIMGYQARGFAVKGEIAQQVERQVIAPLRLELTKVSGTEIHITVTGFADKTGDGAQNDQWAKRRAEEVAGILSDKFPGANITSLSRGDELDVRMVTVSWKRVPLPKTSRIWQLRPEDLVIPVLVTAFLITFLYSRRSRQPRRHEPEQVPIQAVETKEPAAFPPPIPTPKIHEKWFEVKTGGVTRFVLVTQQDTEKGMMFVTPFLSQQEPRKPVMREDRHGVKNALNTCMKNPFYMAEIEECIAAGTIKIKRRT